MYVLNLENIGKKFGCCQQYLKVEFYIIRYWGKIDGMSCNDSESCWLLAYLHLKTGLSYWHTYVATVRGDTLWSLLGLATTNKLCKSMKSVRYGIVRTDVGDRLLAVCTKSRECVSGDGWRWIMIGLSQLPCYAGWLQLLTIRSFGLVLLRCPQSHFCGRSAVQQPYARCLAISMPVPRWVCVINSVAGRKEAIV